MKSNKLIAILTSAVLSASAAFAAPHAKDAATAGAVPKDYPLTKCVVSDEKLGEHGKPVKATTPDGTDVYLCCKDCLKDFKKDPAKYGKMVKDAKRKK